MFVVGAPEDHCREWTRVSPNVARFTVDYDTRTVTARALGMGRQTARFVSATEGCRLVTR